MIWGLFFFGGGLGVGGWGVGVGGSDISKGILCLENGSDEPNA